MMIYANNHQVVGKNTPIWRDEKEILREVTNYTL